MIEIKHGDCLDVLRTLADNSVDSIVTDPPYGLSFMGKKWDYDVPAVEVCRSVDDVIRVVTEHMQWRCEKPTRQPIKKVKA